MPLWHLWTKKSSMEKSFITYTFSKAVKNELLAPYKIIIWGVDEEEVS